MRTLKESAPRSLIASADACPGYFLPGCSFADAIFRYGSA